MVSIRKYLEMGTRPSDDAELGQSPVLIDLCSNILGYISAYILKDKADSPSRASLEQAKNGIHGGMAPAAARYVERLVRVALASHEATEREAAQRGALETQHVVAVLNQALMVIGGSSARSVSRLKHIQAALEHTSKIRDAEGLRASLSQAIELIREEAEREKEHGARELARFQSEVLKVNEHIAANPSRRLSGRAEAIQAISDWLPSLKPAATLYVVAFSFEDIRAIIQRYGPEPLENLSLQLIRERTRPIAKNAESWRWSGGCVVSAFERSCDLAELRSQLNELCAIPLVYHMNLGSRSAVLKVNVSHMVAPAAAQSMKVLIEQVDRFSGAGE